MNSKIFAKLSLSALFFLNTQAASQISKEKFLEAARYGNTATIQRYIDQGGDINEKDHNKWTPLHWAAFNGHTASLELLLKHRASIDIKDNIGCTALHNAALNYRDATLKRLLDQGASIDIKDNQGWTALHWAAGRGNDNAIKILIQRNADCKIEDNNKKTPFDTAIRNQNLDTTKTILREGLVHGQYSIDEVKKLRTQAELVDFNLRNEQNLPQQMKIALEIKSPNLTTSVINPFVTLLLNDPTNQEQKASIKNKVLWNRQAYQNLQDLNKLMRDENKVKMPVPSLQLLCAGFIAKNN